MPNHTYGAESMSNLAPPKAPGDRCACPTCGGLECLCRPRFFPGQLLTEEDLNRLDHYIVGKNRLHNRYLHGWGVVCGLEVVCHPCPGEVTVRSGYALSPCGDDIVVCKDTRVNVCDLINKCKPPSYECEPFRTHGNDEKCKDLTEKWLLAICYDEKPSRGVAALRANTEAPCCSRCSCGGSAACGCSCHEKLSQAKSNGCHPSAKRTPPQCEPTVICEGYRFALFKPPQPKGQGQPSSALAERIWGCIRHMWECIPAVPVDPSLLQAHDWCCKVKDCLAELFATLPVHNCQLHQKLSMLCPSAPVNSQVTGASYLAQAQMNLTSIVAELLKDCFCSVLLPPCPEPSTDSCVVLASVEVRKHDCAIMKICNWDERRTVVTFPTLEYWAGLFIQPVGAQDHALLGQLCCKP